MRENRLNSFCPGNVLQGWFKRDKRREILWFLAAAGLILALTCVPFLAGYLSEPPGSTFAGVLIAPDDNLSYLAKMELGRRGNWLFHLPYTAQSHPGAPLIYIYYIFLGHLAGWLHLPTIAVFHLARLADGFLLLGLSYLLIVQVSDDLNERRTAFLLVGLSSGLGWLTLPLGPSRSTDVNVPESNTFLTLFNNPHFPLSQALITLAFLMLATSTPPSRLRGGLFIAASVLLTLISPYALAILVGVSAVYLGTQWAKSRRFPAVMAAQSALATALSLPIFGLIWYVLKSDPVLQDWHTVQMASPAVWHYGSGYGLILVAAVLGGGVALKRGRPVDRLLVIWVGVTLLLLYSPVSFQRRFSMGLHIPLAILAGVGLYRGVIVRIGQARRRWMTRAILGAMTLTNFVIVLMFLLAALFHLPGLYLTNDEAAGLAWLRSHGEAEAVILSSTELGKFVPVFSGGRAVSGHPFETVNAEVAEADVLRFYDDDTVPELRSALLKKYDVAYIIFGAREEGLNASSRKCLDGLTLIARTGEVEIFALIGVE